MNLRVSIGFILAMALGSVAYGQNSGSIRGTATVADRDLTLQHVTVLISQLGRSTETGPDGAYEFRDVPPGTYDLVASRPGMSAQLQSVTVTAGQTATADIKMNLSPIQQEVTVTATGLEEIAFESFQTVNTLDSYALAERAAPSIGEVLEDVPGVAKRSFGPGTARPVIRGFDGDRVLVTQDGIRTGTLSSQSGDHGEPIDVMSIDRVEVLKGPATLLYGSNAIGGVVNAVSRRFQMREQSQSGVRGYMTGGLGGNNAYGAGSAGFEVGVKNWLFWANGGNQKTRDYAAGGGLKVENAGARLTNGGGGVGWFGDRAFTSIGYTYDDGIYGIPLEEDAEEVVRLDFFRRNVRVSGGVRNPGNAFDAFRANFNYSGWRHKELDFSEGGDPPILGTLFNNKQYTYEFAFDHKRTSRLSGTFGFYGMHRDYDPEGLEAIAPPTRANVAAVFGLEEVKFEHFELQFGGRLEGTRYKPEAATDRSFTGLSAAAGIHFHTWNGGAFVANYTHSYRAPALEELYNNGPHPGNLAFEIGDPNLKRERGDGIDFSLRHEANRLKASGNFYFYHLKDYVFLAPTGEEEDGLRVAEYRQGTTRYVGTELAADANIHPYVWVNTSLDYTNAQLTSTNTPVPRIPPLRGRLGIEFRRGGLSIKPEIVMANRQSRIFTTETETAGYTVFNLDASYTVAMQHLSHHFSVNAFNLGDRFYQNHVSLIKDVAPEIGRGVRVTYSVRFF